MINIADAYGQIKLLFIQLDDTDKEKLLEELKPLLKAPISIPEFALLMQRMYRKNISFKISVDIQNNIPFVSATVLAPYGEFTAIGKNKNVAKERAVIKAFEEFNRIKL